MANQITQTQGSAIGQLGEGVKTGKAKGDVKGGLFATLIASFQKHIKQTEAGLQVDGQKISGKEKIAADGLKAGFLKVNAGGIDAVGKAKGSLKLAHTDKTSEGENVKEKSSLHKAQLQASKGQSLVENTGDKKDILNLGKLVDDTEKLQKHAVIGLGISQQESHQPIKSKLGEADVKEKLFTELENKGNKQTKDSGKSPRLVMDAQDATDKKGIAVGQKKAATAQNKTEKVVAEVFATEGKAVEASPVKGSAQGRFALKDVDGIDDGVDVSKLIARDELVSVKKQSKGNAIDTAVLKNQVKGEDAAAKAVSLASSSDDAKVIAQDDMNKRQMIESNQTQSKQVKEGQFQQGLDAAENVSKMKSSFKGVVANRSGALGVQPQASASMASSIQPETVMASANGQDANMSGDDRGTGRSAAELLMSDGSIRDSRSTRSDFAMQMAYRSAASFKPSDAMLEISKAAKDGTFKLELMLEPATLGKIQVSLQTDAQKQIQVHLIVDQQASRQVLEQQLPQLRQALADQGLSLSGFTMDMNSQQQSDGKASHDVAGMNQMNSHGELENVMSLETPLRMGVNVADDGSLSILA